MKTFTLILLIFLSAFMYFNCKPKQKTTTNIDQINFGVEESEKKNTFQELGFTIDGTGSIITYNGNDTNVVIPGKIAGVTITAIGKEVFFEKGLTSIVIPDSVTSIGYLAFAYNQLTNVTIPDNVKTIDQYAFMGNYIKSVNIPNGVHSIGRSAFLMYQMENITIPDSVTLIRGNVFGEFNDPLTRSITIGSNVEFEYSVEVDGQITYPFSTDFDKFYDAYGKKAGTYVRTNDKWKITGDEIIKENDFEIDRNGTIIAYNGSDKSIDIPDMIGGIPAISISYGIFRNISLENVTIPEGITSIEDWAFGLNNLQTIIIPKSVTVIGSHVFFANGMSNIIIPESVSAIGDYAFARNYLGSITLPENITSISKGALSHNFLKNIIIPNNVTSIGVDAFFANQITDIIIPDSVKSIGKGAFTNNPITSVTIGENVILGYLVSEYSTISFDYTFDSYYNEKGKKAGTYILNDRQWTMK